ncbi:MAG TPA: CCA tRNA nucleotidyltransferase [Longimicrobiales bacterium]
MAELNPPAGVVEIARKFQANGYECWAVGGAVRDAFIGVSHADWDLATDARPKDMQELFRRTVPVGVEHGTVGIFASDGVMYEVTTFRRDVETTGRHAVVQFASDIRDDLARRDFTINALAWNPLTQEMLDPFGGMTDLQDGVLRTVGTAADRFAEDWLRILRALRFAGHFVLTFEPATWLALTDSVEQLRGLSAERVREELLKILAKTQHASAALRLYESSGALRVLYPELHAMVGVSPPDGSGDVWQRTLIAVDAIPRTRVQLRLAALLHGAGVPAARSRDLRGGWSYAGHEPIGQRKAEEVLRRLKASNSDIEHVSRLVGLQSALFPPDAPDAGVRRWLTHVPAELRHDLFRLRIALWRAAQIDGAVDADAFATGVRDLTERWQHVRKVLRAAPPLSINDLAVDGGDLKGLGMPPGPRYGEILRDLLDRVLEDPSLNERETLVAIVRAEHMA